MTGMYVDTPSLRGHGHVTGAVSRYDGDVCGHTIVTRCLVEIFSFLLIHGIFVEHIRHLQIIIPKPSLEQGDRMCYVLD